MYQFTSTYIINSALDSNGTSAKYAGLPTYFEVKRVGKFLKDNILSVSKRPYVAGVKEVAQVTIPVITAGLVARVEIDIRLSQQTNSEYASTHLYFSKPVTVEVVAVGVAATDATALKVQINKLKDRYGFAYVTATTSGANLIITATDVNQRINNIVISKEAGVTDNSIVEPAYTDVSASTFSVTTSGVTGFGDTTWMSQKIVIPTMENTRTFGISQDEKPVVGGNYTQYTLRYSIENEGDDGVFSGSKSITTHVFYVLSTLVSSFEAALLASSLPIATIGTTVTGVVISGNSYDLSDAEDITLVATTTPAGVTGGIWSLTGDNTVAGTLAASTISITSAGVFSIDGASGLANADTIGVQVVIDGYTKTGDITIVT